MRTFYFHLLVAFIALALSLAYTTHAVASRTLITHGISYTTMDDAWNPSHQHGRGRKSASRGGGGRGGRQAPAAAGRGPPPPGSPVASHISVQHNIPSFTDNLLDKFLRVRPIAHTEYTTVDLAHAKKSQSGLKTTGASRT
jgi:hypothetical protein